MQKLLVTAIAFSVLLLVPGGVLNAFGGDADIPVSIVFKEKKGDCKIIKINKGVMGGRDLLIKNVRVDIISDTIKPGMPITIDPPTTVKRTTTSADFVYKPDKSGKATTPPMATLTICPEGLGLVVRVKVATEPKTQIGELIINEQIIDAKPGQDNEFTNTFLVPKKLPTDCTDKITITGSTNVVKDTLDIKCKGGPGSTSIVTITGNLIKITKPAIAGIVIDPLGDTFLLVTEVCVIFADDSFVCPTDIDLDLTFDLPTKAFVPVGGTLVPIDTTALLLAGAQMNAAWLIPLIVAAVGIGIFVIKRRK